METSAEFKLTLTALFSDKFKLVEIRIDAKRLVFRQIQIGDKDNMVKVGIWDTLAKICFVISARVSSSESGLTLKVFCQETTSNWLKLREIKC